MTVSTYCLADSLAIPRNLVISLSSLLSLPDIFTPSLSGISIFNELVFDNFLTDDDFIEPVFSEVVELMLALIFSYNCVQIWSLVKVHEATRSNQAICGITQFRVNTSNLITAPSRCIISNITFEFSSIFVNSHSLVLNWTMQNECIVYFVQKNTYWLF